MPRFVLPLFMLNCLFSYAFGYMATQFCLACHFQIRSSSLPILFFKPSPQQELRKKSSNSDHGDCHEFQQCQQYFKTTHTCQPSRD